MATAVGLPRDELLFGFVISAVHAGQHLFLRLLPPLIPILVVDFDTPLWKLGLLVSVYLFAGGLFQAPVGELVDRFDRQYLLVPAFIAMGIGYFVFVFAEAIGSLLPHVTLFGHGFDGPYQIMVLGMFTAGVGYSIIHPVGYPLISANVSLENKGKVLGMWGSASKVGDAMAPLLVGVALLVVSWEWILLGVSVFGFAFAIGLFLLFRADTFETRPPGEVNGDDAAEDAPSIWSDPRRFLFPITVVVMSFFFILFAGNGIQTYAPAFVADVYGISFSIAGTEIATESVANFYFGILLISGALAQLVIGVLTDMYDYRAILITMLAIGAMGLALLSTVTLTPLVLLIVFIVVGSCQFGLNPARDAIISDITPAQYEGRVFGYIWTVALVGSSIFPTVIGYLADMIGLQQSFWFLALASLGALATIGLLYSPRVYRTKTSPSNV